MTVIGGAVAQDDHARLRIRRASGSVQLVDADGTVYPLTVATGNWTSCQHHGHRTRRVALWGQRRAAVDRHPHDNARSTITGLTVQVGLRTGVKPCRRCPGFADDSGWLSSAIQQAIDAAGDNDLILVRPGTYDEMVIMWKPVQLQGWGPGAVTINAVNTPMEKLQLWRQKVEQLVEDVRRGPAAGPGGRPSAASNRAPCFTEEGAGVIVLAKDNRTAAVHRFNPSTAAPGSTVSPSAARAPAAASSSTVMPTTWRSATTIIQNNSGFFGGGVRLGHPELTDPDTESLCGRQQRQDQDPPQPDFPERRPGRRRRRGVAVHRFGQLPT